MAHGATFSVVIPTYNRPERLHRCLESLTRLHYPRQRFNVVVVDDGGRKPIDTVVATFRDALEINLIRQSNAGPAAARNTGARAATGETIAFTDDDCCPQPGWLAAFEAALMQSPNALVGGRIVNALDDNPFAIASQLITDFAYTREVPAEHKRLFASCNIACRREPFIELGGFDETFPLAAGEDYDFCHRWQHAGRPTAYSADAAIEHFHGGRIDGFCKQHFAYGRGLFQFRKLAAAREAQPSGASPQHMSFYFDLLRYPFGRKPLPEALVYCGLVLMSQVATAAGGLRQLIADRISSKGVALSTAGQAASDTWRGGNP